MCAHSDPFRARLMDIVSNKYFYRNAEDTQNGPRDHPESTRGPPKDPLGHQS